MHNSSKYGVNDTHAIDSGLKRCSLGMKTTQSSNSKWVSIDRPNAKVIMRSPPPSNRNDIFQTMTTTTNESNHYCNNFLHEQQQLDQNQSIFNQTKQYAFPPYGQRNIHIEEKLLNRNIAKKYNNSDMASIHYRPVRTLNHYSNTNYNNNNVNVKANDEGDGNVQSPRWIRITEDQQFTVEHQPLLLLDANSSYSNTTNQHYEHYYSYYYDRQPIRKQLLSTGRKLPDTLMATRKNCSKIEAKNHRTIATTSMSSDNQKKQNEPHPIHDHQNVLKENNNIIASPTDEWLAKMNGDELLGLTSEFMDVKDVNVYEDELNLMYGTGGKLLRSKRKLQKCAKSSGGIPSNGNNNSPWFHDEKACGDAAPYNKNTEYKKLPATPQKTSGKKYSPLPHKVLHYGNQSPRLHRLSPRHTARSKSPALTIQNKPISHRSSADNTNKKDPKTDCYSSVIKSFAPATTPILGVKGKRLSTQTVKREHGGATQLTETDSAADSDDNVGDDDDDIDNDIDDLDNVSGANDSSDTDDTSDSEDGYRVYAYKLTHSLERISFAQSNLSSEATEDELQSPPSVLVPSLFPHVPPYLAFSSNKQKGPNVPAELHRVLKWRVTNVMPKVVRCILANSGMRLLKKTNDWMGIWGKHMKSPCFKTIRPYQKINHLPGSFKIGRKDSCWKNLLKQMNKHGKKEFGFMPKTYIIPHDLNLLRKHWPKYAQRNVKWIIKPPASARGTGIRVVDRWAQIPKRKPLIVQKYIERPLLINGSKFDLRLYVLVTSVNPLRVFMYHNGLARFASVKYSDRSDTLNDRCMHLTNYSINKLSSNYAKNEDVNACHGHKWTIKSLWSYLANRGVRTDCLWEALRNLVLRTILAGEQSINNMIRMNMESKYSCFELFGFDVLLDAELIPWLLEVNISPSLHSELPLDAHVKAPLVQGVLNTALFQVPPKLSHEAQKQIVSQLQLPAGALCYDKRLYINYLSRTEKIKHTTFTRKSLEDRDEYINSILDNLTPDDIRCLIVAEDELARSTPLERIFPTNQTYKYLKYTDCPRYYNRLLDAWETRYANNRTKGIALLQRYCEEKYHLEVPPSPAKKDSNVDNAENNVDTPEINNNNSYNDVETNFANTLEKAQPST